MGGSGDLIRQLPDPRNGGTIDVRSPTPPAEMDEILQRVAGRDQATGAIRDLFDSADAPQLQFFAESIARNGGPDSRAIALEWLTQAQSTAADNDRERAITEGMTQIINSGGGNVIDSARGPSAIRNAIRETLAGDAPPTASNLDRMTANLPMNRAVAMDEALRDGFQDHLNAELGGNVAIDILSRVSVSGSAEVNVESGRGSAGLGVQLTDLNLGEILSGSRAREAQAVISQFANHMESYRRASPQDLELYGQTLQRERAADAIVGGRGSLAMPD